MSSGKMLRFLKHRQLTVTSICLKGGKHGPPPPPPAYGSGSKTQGAGRAGKGASTSPSQSGSHVTESPPHPASKSPTTNSKAHAQQSPAAREAKSQAAAHSKSQLADNTAQGPLASSKSTDRMAPADSVQSQAEKALKQQVTTPAGSSTSKVLDSSENVKASAGSATQPKASSMETLKVTGPEPSGSAAQGGVGKDRAKQHYFTGSAGPSKVDGASGGHNGSKPGQGNAWLLSKSVPVDVRLLGAGVVSVGALYYYSYRDGKKQIDQQPRTEEDSSMEDSGALNSRPGGDKGFPAESEESSSGSVMDDTLETSNSAPPGAHAQPELAGPLPAGDFYTDELAMDSQSSSDEERGHSKESEVQPVQLPPPDASQLKIEGIDNAAKVVKRSIQNGQPVEVVDTKPVVDLLDEVGRMAWQPQQAQPEEAAMSRTEFLTGDASDTAADGNLPRIQELVGIFEDLSAEALVRKAIERTEEQGADWTLKHESLVQARADAETIQQLLQQAYNFQQAKVAAAMAQAKSNAEHAKEIQRAADAAKEQFLEVLNQTEMLLEAQRKRDLARQEQFLTTAAAEAAMRERKDRLQAVDEVRVRLNALSQAFSRRSEEQKDSTQAHLLSLGTFALENALAQGLPFSKAASRLASSCNEDELVSAALQALPKYSADRGIPTRAELVARAPALIASAKQMAYLEPGRGGMLSFGLARMAAAFKVPQAPMLGSDGGLDEALASMQAHLSAGRLLEAAHALEEGTKGTAAAATASEWAQHARARALADQTVELLQAHACSLSACQS